MGLRLGSYQAPALLGFTFSFVPWEQLLTASSIRPRISSQQTDGVGAFLAVLWDQRKGGMGGNGGLGGHGEGEGKLGSWSWTMGKSNR